MRWPRSPRLRRDERGELSIALVFAATALVAFGVTAIAGLDYVFSDAQNGRNAAIGTVPIDDTILSNPPKCPAARDLAASRGLRFSAKGWRLNSHDGPVYNGENPRQFNARFASYRGEVLAQVSGIVDDMEKECHKQDDLGGTTTSSPPPTIEQKPVIPGTYRYDPDASGSTAAAECQDTFRVLQISVTGTQITISGSGTGEPLTYQGELNEYTFQARATNPDGTDIGSMTGRFSRFGDDTLLDGGREVTVGGGCQFRFRGTRNNSP